MVTCVAAKLICAPNKSVVAKSRCCSFILRFLVEFPRLISLERILTIHDFQGLISESFNLKDVVPYNCIIFCTGL